MYDPSFVDIAVYRAALRESRRWFRDEDVCGQLAPEIAAGARLAVGWDPSQSPRTSRHEATPTTQAHSSLQASIDAAVKQNVARAFLFCCEDNPVFLWQATWCLVRRQASKRCHISEQDESSDISSTRDSAAGEVMGLIGAGRPVLREFRDRYREYGSSLTFCTREADNQVGDADANGHSLPGPSVPDEELLEPGCTRDPDDCGCEAQRPREPNFLAFLMKRINWRLSQVLRTTAGGTPFWNPRLLENVSPTDDKSERYEPRASSHHANPFRVLARHRRHADAARALQLARTFAEDLHEGVQKEVVISYLDWIIEDPEDDSRTQAAFVRRFGYPSGTVSTALYRFRHALSRKLRDRVDVAEIFRGSTGGGYTS